MFAEPLSSLKNSLQTRGNQNRKYFNFFLCHVHWAPSEDETSLFFASRRAFPCSQANIQSSKLIHAGASPIGESKCFCQLLNNFPHDPQHSPNRICWLQWQGQCYRVTHCRREQTSSTKATSRCKCCFLIAWESCSSHKIERKRLCLGVPAVSDIPGPPEIHTPSNNCSPPLPLPTPRVHQLHSVPQWKYSWTWSSPALTHATSQKLALPRSPVTCSLPKRNGASPSWCSLTYVQNLTLLITNYTTLSSWLLSLFPHLVCLSPHLL